MEKLITLLCGADATLSYGTENATKLSHNEWSLFPEPVTYAYQVSLPCIVWFASLRSEEVVIRKSAKGNFFHGCHGNAEIHMRTKFHFHALHGLQV